MTIRRGHGCCVVTSSMKAQPLALALAALLPVMPAAAQELTPAAIRTSAACAPVGTVWKSTPLRVSAAAPLLRALYNAGQRVAIDGGTAAGVQAGQRYFIRRAMSVRGAPGAEHTVGWLHIVDTSESTATGEIDFTCDAVAVGDHLEPYATRSFLRASIGPMRPANRISRSRAQCSTAPMAGTWPAPVTSCLPTSGRSKA